MVNQQGQPVVWPVAGALLDTPIPPPAFPRFPPRNRAVTWRIVLSPYSEGPIPLPLLAFVGAKDRFLCFACSSQTVCPPLDDKFSKTPRKLNRSSRKGSRQSKCAR